eukprot:tig00000889_g5311.t1
MASEALYPMPGGEPTLPGAQAAKAAPARLISSAPSAFESAPAAAAPASSYVSPPVSYVAPPPPPPQAMRSFAAPTVAAPAYTTPMYAVPVSTAYAMPASNVAPYSAGAPLVAPFMHKRYHISTAYLLWMVSWFGVAGLHRLYVGKICTGLLWLFTLGLFMVGTIVDAFLARNLPAAPHHRAAAAGRESAPQIPGMVERENARHPHAHGAGHATRT